MYDEDDEHQYLLDQHEQDGVIESIHTDYKKYSRQMDYFFIIICCLGFIASAIPYYQNEASIFFLALGLQFPFIMFVHFYHKKISLFFAWIPFLTVISAYLYWNPSYPSEFFWPVQFVWVLTFFLEYGFRTYKKSILQSISKLESLKYNFMGN